MSDAGPNAALSELRRRVVALDRSARAKRVALPFGVPAIDAHLPWGGLPLGQVHECLEEGVAGEHAAAATLFAAGILARCKGTVLWCLRGRDLFAPALAAVGLGPDRVIYVETWKDSEVLPAMEEGLRHGGLAGVVGGGGPALAHRLAPPSARG
jgi:protein ImuA